MPRPEPRPGPAPDPSIGPIPGAVPVPPPGARATPRRAVLAAVLAAAAVPALPGAASAAGSGPAPGESRRPVGSMTPMGTLNSVDNRFWTTRDDWRSGTGPGTHPSDGRRPGLAIRTPDGVTTYRDPHTGRTGSYEYAVWTSPLHRCRVPATEIVPSWNADTPPGTWLAVELCGAYENGSRTPWYVLGRWASGETEIRRTSVDAQGDGRSSVSTDTVGIGDPASGARLIGYQLRVILYRLPGSDATPTLWRLGAMSSAVPDRFTVPASVPVRAGELKVPRHSQEIHVGQYPEYDNGGEAWCSPTSTTMVLEHWGRGPTAEDLAWVNPAYADPQVCHAARQTYDHQYAGCGNWPFNAAYAATYRDLNAVVTRLGSLNDLENLIRAGIPAMTSQSFLDKELTGAGYGTSGHLMTVVGFTAAGDVVANDPAAPTNDAVRRVYRRREFENVWLRTKRYGANGTVASATGGVCYLYWPLDPTPVQRRALEAVGVR
ncbi:peptidase C39 family protein [Streptomyces sp. NBC_00237]|uniref:peptidase C39 family protein n=1 Tax=Streptomyces sp. NBC_00237 TaxID=2975687 RepID=UPI00224E02B1|nr:peptidase C39 family protein [Streptomyces sp. NBC_00237]MCX5202627.1 peptidase C39 family protein [Streptomyces sp. NBC_00237]